MMATTSRAFCCAVIVLFLSELLLGKDSSEASIAENPLLAAFFLFVKPNVTFEVSSKIIF